MRLYRAVLVVPIVFLLAIAACSNPTSVTNAPQGAQTQQLLAAVTATPPPALNGTVTSIVSATEFIYQTGSPHGRVHVLYSSSMVVPSGSTIQVGQAISVAGTFSSSGQLIASTVTTTVTLSGTVTSIISPTEFGFQAGNPHGHVVVVYSAATLVPSGSTIRVGQSAAVTGTLIDKLTASSVNLAGSSSPSPSPSPTVAPPGPYHIATWALDNYWAQGESATAASVNQLVSYAQGNGKSVADCHSGSQSCKAVFYLNPNHEYNGSPASCVTHPDADVLAAASESWFVHDTGYTDSGHRVYGKSKAGCLIWELNPNSADVQSWWLSYLQSNANNYDFYMLDHDPMDVVGESYFTGSGGGCSPWPSYCHSTQEIADDTSQVLAHANFANAMSHSNGSPMYFFYQQASFNTTLDVSAFATTSRFVGLSCEGCVATNPSVVRPTMYAKVLNEMAAINLSSGAFMLISDGISPAGTSAQILQRLVTTGIIWLGYSEGHTIVEPNLEATTNNLAIWPEDLIYPSQPLQSMISGANDLQVASGVWRREFSSCYQASLSFGRCAAIVNSTGNALAVNSAWLSGTYGHVITLSGGDALSGGAASVSTTPFVPNVTTVPATGALLLAQ